MSCVIPLGKFIALYFLSLFVPSSAVPLLFFCMPLQKSKFWHTQKKSNNQNLQGTPYALISNIFHQPLWPWRPPPTNLGRGFSGWISPQFLENFEPVKLREKILAWAHTKNKWASDWREHHFVEEPYPPPPLTSPFSNNIVPFTRKLVFSWRYGITHVGGYAIALAKLE